jgi:hypothetical protein
MVSILLVVGALGEPALWHIPRKIVFASQNGISNVNLAITS